MLLSRLLAGLPVTYTLHGAADPDITAITADSRQVTPGALFVATQGETVDAHRFIPDAVARGAAAIVLADLAYRPADLPTIQVTATRPALAWLCAAWYGFPARALTLIGVTGTDGKTTTSTLIHAILQAAGYRAGLISTVGALIGDQLLDTGFHVTTPDAPDIQRYLADMVRAGLTHVALEATSHGLAQDRVTGCDVDVAVVTNITHEHLDYHKTYDNYRAAKARLFEFLDTSAAKPGVPRCGALNADDSSFTFLAGRFTAPRLAYGLAQGEVRAAGLTATPAGWQFTVVSPAGAHAVTTPLVGLYNVSNILAAWSATVVALGVEPLAAARGIASVAGVPGRMERIDLGQPFTAIVDFAHTPNALKNALLTARQLLNPAAPLTPHSVPRGRGRVIAVFGSAGLRDVEKRRLMAETSAELADLTILTAEDPRTEPLEAILEMMAFGARRKGGVEGHTFFRVPDRGEALRLAVRLAQPGDVVLACGKGHEQSMCFGAVEYPWDDRIALRAALAEHLGVPGPAMPALPTSGLLQSSP